MSLVEQIQELLHTKIPITRAMGVRVEDYDGERLVLSAPRKSTSITWGPPLEGAFTHWRS